MILEKKSLHFLLFLRQISCIRVNCRDKSYSLQLGLFQLAVYMINLVIILLGLLSAHELVSSGNLLTSTNERIHKYPFGCLLWVQCQACI